MSFELIFITEGPEGSPAAEIQFGGQRLCVVRQCTSGVTQIEFVDDLYVDRSVKMSFPLSEFQEILEVASRDLAAWLRDISDSRTESEL